MATDLYQDCQHCWHQTGTTQKTFPDEHSFSATDAEEVCCHCGVHRWVPTNFVGDRLHGRYVPSEGIPVNDDGTVTISGPVIHFPPIE